MKTFRITSFMLAVIASFIVVGCGGGGSGTVPTQRAPGGSPSGTYSVKIVIPAVAAATAGARRPAYVPANLQSVVVQIMNGSTSLVSGNDYVNVTATGSSSGGSCTTSASGTTCTITVDATIGAAGTYTVVVATYDAQQTSSCMPNATSACAGKLLSISELPQTITPGASGSLAVTLGGIPAYIQPLELLSGYIGGTKVINSTGLTVYGPGAHAVQIEFLDSDKNVIIGPGTPTLTATSAMPSVLAASVAGPSNGGSVYTITFTPQVVTSSAGPVVQATSVPVQMSASVSGTALSANVVTLAMQIQHSAIYVARPTAPGSGVLTIDAFLDGNTTPSETMYNAGENYLYLATDDLDDLWISDTYNNDLVEFPPVQPGVTPSQSATVSGNGISIPTGLTFDGGNTAYVASCPPCLSQTGPYTINAYPPSANVPSFSGAPFTYLSSTSTTVGALTADSGGQTVQNHVYAATYDTGTSTWSLVAFNAGSATMIPLYSAPVGTTIAGLAIDPSAAVWMLLTTGATETAERFNPQTQTVATTITSGLPANATGIATDQLGNVFVVGSGTNGVVEFSPPSYGATTLGSVASPVNLVVVPSGLEGNQDTVGVPVSPLPSPLPIPTP